MEKTSQKIKPRQMANQPINRLGMNPRSAPQGSYLYVAPVSGVLFSPKSSQEFHIDKVTLFSKKAFLRTRRYHLQIGPKDLAQHIQHWPDTVKTIAVMDASGTPADMTQECHLCVKEELNILASVRLGTSKRTRRSAIGTAGSSGNYIVQDLAIGRNVEWIRSNFSNVTHDHLFLGADFLYLTKNNHFFHILLQTIRQASSANPEWKAFLRSVAVLLGKSQNSIEAADAFLWDMIALEQLLIESNERQRHLEILITRIKALLGYCPLWNKHKLEAQIRELYKLRCALVHEGKRSVIDIRHIIMADRLIRNIVTAIMQNRRHFSSKNDIIQFSEIAKARDLLGMPARPKNWVHTYYNLMYTDKDIEKHWKL